jgi:hypothetical protein
MRSPAAAGIRRAIGLAAAAGFGAGVAVLTKSSLWLVVPWVLLPLFATEAWRARITVAVAGLSLPAGLWGWGPRLIVPAIPLLAAAAAMVLDRCPQASPFIVYPWLPPRRGRRISP